jgi:hypothetical protein
MVLLITGKRKKFPDRFQNLMAWYQAVRKAQWGYEGI